jgi:hypothetical protein
MLAGGLSLWAVSSLMGGEAVAQVSIEELEKVIQQQQRQLEAQQQSLQQLQQQLEEVKGSMAVVGDELETQKQAVDELGGVSNAAVSGQDNVVLSISGQLNRAVLWSDDGNDKETYFVDNDNSSSRVRFIGEGEINENFIVGGIMEYAIKGNSSTSVNQLDKNESSGTFQGRQISAYVRGDNWGTVTIGQGSTASDGTAEVDHSGTTVVGYSSVADMAGGLFFRQQDDSFSDIKVGSAFTNFDGLGRQNRLRYDTPTYSGFTAGVSVSQPDNDEENERAADGETTDNRWDVAGRYSREFGSVTLGAALAYSQVDSPTIDDSWDGSISMLHESGFNATLAAARANARSDSTRAEDAKYWYGKFGYVGKWFSLGDTAIAADYYAGKDVFSDGYDSTSFGLMLVQNVRDYGTEFYAGFRTYDLDAPGGAAQLENITAVMTGARVKF